MNEISLQRKCKLHKSEQNGNVIIAAMKYTISRDCHGQLSINVFDLRHF